MEGETFVCDVCEANFNCLRNHAHHQKLHQLNRTFSFHCGALGCFKEFLTFSDLNSHISKTHQEHRQRTSERERFLHCPVCNEQLNSVLNLCHHVKDKHVKDGVACPLKVLDLDDCKRELPLKTASTFMKHLSQHHSGWQEFPLPPSCAAPTEDEQLSSQEGDGDEEEEEEEIFYDCDDTFHFNEEEVFLFIGRFYLMMETECFLPVSTIDKISKCLTTLSEMIQSSMRRKLVSQLLSLDLSEDTVESTVCELADSNLLLLSHRKDLRGPCFTTDHLRTKYYEAKFGLRSPQSVPLSNDPLKPDSFQFVPPRKTIEDLLKDPSVKKEITDSFERFSASDANAANGIYKDYHDGSVMRNRKLPVKRIDIIVFQDGFAATTMLTTVRQRHNTLGVYISLGNIRPWRRTKLKAMQMVMIVLEADVKVYRQKCFELLVNHFLDLEQNGVDFLGERIPVFLQFCVGDNKGQHFIGGFVESFTAIYFCRFCPIKRENFLLHPLLLEELRTNKDYEDSAKIAKNPNINNHMGVKEISVLNKLEHFSACDPSLPPCIGHDLFLGALDLDMRALIGQFVKEGYFKIEFLNKRIESFAYASSDSKNKPAPVREDGETLGGSAVQNWLLIRLFVFIIGDKIPTDNIYWQLYLLLKQICEYVCAPVISEGQINELEVILFRYLSRRNILPPTPKPKHHYMRHYCDLIRKFGPLIHLWGMRFEQKHQTLKRIAKTCNNFINLLHTLATRNQLHFTYECEGRGRRFSASVKCKPVQLKPGVFSTEIFDFILSQIVSTNAQTAKVIKINGQVYREKEWLILDSTASHISVGLIKGMIILDSKVNFVLKEMKAFRNNDHGVYEICETTSELTYVAFENLLHPCPISVYEYLEKLCFSLKNTIPTSELLSLA